MAEVTNELVIDGDWSPQEGATVVIVKKLVVKSGSRITVDGKIEDFRLRCEESQFEGHTCIDGRGSGPGDDGVNLELYLGKATIGSLTIDTTGAKGSKGAKGPRGRKGRNASCAGDGAGNGGPGGKGAEGGAGGRGGNVTLGVDASSPIPRHLEIIPQGGPGGDGGDGGDGGRGGSGAKCLFWKRGPGRHGPRGAGGDPGPEGHDGEVNVLRVSELGEFLQKIYS